MMCRVWLLQSSSVQQPRRPISGLVLVVVAYVETYTCVSCRLVAPWCVGGGVMSAGAHRARAVSQSRLLGQGRSFAESAGKEPRTDTSEGPEASACFQ